MSDSGSTGSNDPYDPNRPPPPPPSSPPPPPSGDHPTQPQWGTNPPEGQQGGQPAQPGQPYGSPQYGAPQYGQPYGQPAGSPPPNYLVWAILSTIFCCLPLGIASIVFAAQVNGKYAAGDVAGAQESSRKAKQFAIWSAVVGVVVGALYAVAVVAAGVGSD
ncbi:MAG TPA: CD225/dispanin family protein [Actinomycetes bacterium]|nr:CD225/dispanin family protein [Actinomycetes bacterium]